jgi:hypothetical protein
MVYTYDIKLIEYHIYTDKNTFCVWYDNHYIHDFVKISDTHVYDVRKKVKRRLLPYYQVSCLYNDDDVLKGFNYSQQSLKRQLRRELRTINRNVILKKANK